VFRNPLRPARMAAHEAAALSPTALTIPPEWTSTPAIYSFSRRGRFSSASER
jgi:hypothetical protein